jgi:hypothetical protein
VSHGFGFFPTKSAAFDLREPLGNIPSGYLAEVLKRGTANATILRRVALELSKRTDLNNVTKHRVMREGTGSCDWCERVATRIHGHKRSCSRHKDLLTAARSKTMAPVTAALEEHSRDLDTEQKRRDRLAIWKQVSHSGKGGR